MNPDSKLATGFCSFLLLAIVLHPCSGLGYQSTKGNDGKRPAGTHSTKAESTESAVPSHFENGQRFLAEGKFQEAVQEFRLSLENEPNNEAAHFRKALALTHLAKSED